MEYLFQVLILFISNLLSFLIGNRNFKKDNLKHHLDNFFIPFKKHYDNVKFVNNSFPNNVVDAIFEEMIDYENKTQFFTNTELKLLNSLSSLDRFDISTHEKIISTFFELSSQIRKRYNKVATLYFYPKWID